MDILEKRPRKPAPGHASALDASCKLLAFVSIESGFARHVVFCAHKRARASSVSRFTVSKSAEPRLSTRRAGPIRAIATLEQLENIVNTENCDPSISDEVDFCSNKRASS
jgi:hypothetical protein